MREAQTQLSPYSFHHTTTVCPPPCVEPEQVCYNVLYDHSILELIRQEGRMSVVSLLSQADIFDELTPTQLELIGSICAERHYQASDVIFEENTPGDEMYIIASGEVQIQVDPALIGRETSGESQTIATLRRGQSF